MSPHRGFLPLIRSSTTVVERDPEIRPSFGYFPKPSKTWLIVKPEFLEKAKVLFGDSDINITDRGHKYLGSYIGCDSGKAVFVKSQVTSR